MYARRRAAVAPPPARGARRVAGPAAHPGPLGAGPWPLRRRALIARITARMAIWARAPATAAATAATAAPGVDAAIAPAAAPSGTVFSSVTRTAVQKGQRRAVSGILERHSGHFIV